MNRWMSIRVDSAFASGPVVALADFREDETTGVNARELIDEMLYTGALRALGRPAHGFDAGINQTRRLKYERATVAGLGSESEALVQRCRIVRPTRDQQKSGLDRAYRVRHETL